MEITYLRATFNTEDVNVRSESVGREYILFLQMFLKIFKEYELYYCALF
jgi:hypothetical protein